MKKKIFTALLLTALIGFKTQATHYIGGEISYAKLAPAVYVVTYKNYRDCMGVQSANSETLQIESPGCNNGRSFTAAKVSSYIGQIYGQGGSNVCNSTTFNYEVTTYQATLTFSGAEQSCTDWIISSRQSSRPNLANIMGQGWFYTESTLKLDSTINNFSPKFDDINPPVIVVPAGQPVLLSMSATDLDGDSLSYELAQPLDDHNSPVPYLTIPAAVVNSWLPAEASGPFLNPATGNCYVYNKMVSQGCSTLYKNFPFGAGNLPYQSAVIPLNYCGTSGSNTYSAIFPLPSYRPLDWVTNCQTNIPAGPYFNFSPQFGSLEFTLSYFNASSAPHAGDNKYAISFIVKEWRRNGSNITLLSQVRRETMVFVGAPSSNVPPRLAGPSGTPNPTKAFVINAGSTLNYSFLSTDANAADNITMLSDADTKLPGATFNIINASLPSGTLNWTPTSAQARLQPYYFNILLKDDASLRGYTVETIKVEVRNSNINSVKDDIKNNAQLTAFPNPYTDQVNFKLNVKQKTTGQLIIYNILGSEVDRVDLNNLPAGEHQVLWKNASKVPAGQYVARLKAENNSGQTIKFIKLK